jgi:cation:H+ antiporter
MTYGILIAGLLLVLAGSEMTTRGAVGLARQFGVPPLVTGILVIAVLAVIPELFVTLRAVTMGHTDLALGGLIGTSILDILFVMGLGALIQPMASSPKVVFRDGGVLLLAALGVIGCALAGGVSRVAGGVLFAGFIAYVVLLFFSDWRRTADHSVPLARAQFRSEGEMPSLSGAFFVTILGLIVLALGAHLGVHGVVHLATMMGWNETTTGVLVVAAGLSSPKLLVTMWAAFRGRSAVAAGHVIGACAFNLTLVLGLTALLRPLHFPPLLAGQDIYVLALAALALIPLLAMRWRLSRPRGILLILAYGCYVGFVLWRQGLPLPFGW